MPEEKHILKVSRKTVVDEWDLPYGGIPDEGVSIISDEVIGTGRWSIHHVLIVQIKDKFYRTSYSVGSTEYQDEQPWQHDDEVVFREVRKVQKVIDSFE